MESSDARQDEERFLRVLGDASAALEAEGVDYLLMGGVGSAAVGRPRWTHDIDFFVRPEDARQVLDALESAGFTTTETYPDWLFKAFKDDVLVDIIFKSAGGIYLDDEMLTRSSLGDFKGQKVRLIAPEDLIVIKAVVSDEHIPRHWYDALGLISFCRLDWDYLVRRATQFGARRVLSLLLYAQSNDLVVPAGSIKELFRAIYTE
jgi:predicted nucleotidyltransferase